MTVSVISADMEKGMLDIEVKVVQEEKNALLSKGIRQKGNEIVVRRTVIFNRASG